MTDSFGFPLNPSEIEESALWTDSSFCGIKKILLVACIMDIRYFLNLFRTQLQFVCGKQFYVSSRNNEIDAWSCSQINDLRFQVFFILLILKTASYFYFPPSLGMKKYWSFLLYSLCFLCSLLCVCVCVFDAYWKEKSFNELIWNKCLEWAE